MSARDYATGDDLADLHRTVEREINKLELRVEQQIDSIFQRTSANVAHGSPTAHALAALRVEVSELRDAIIAMGKVISRHQLAIEELSL